MEASQHLRQELLDLELRAVSWRAFCSHPAEPVCPGGSVRARQSRSPSYQIRVQFQQDVHKAGPRSMTLSLFHSETSGSIKEKAYSEPAGDCFSRSTPRCEIGMSLYASGSVSNLSHVIILRSMLPSPRWSARNLPVPRTNAFGN